MSNLKNVLMIFDTKLHLQSCYDPEVFKVTGSVLEANGSEEKLYVLKLCQSGFLTKYWVGYLNTTFCKTSSKNNTLSWFHWIFSLLDVVLFFKHKFKVFLILMNYYITDIVYLTLIYEYAIAAY